MSDERTPQRRPDELSNDRGHDANNPSLKRDPRANQPDDERRSRQADVGDAPEQGGDGIQPQDAGEDMPATYEPDKRPSQRNTL
jgi:hypothetical protein